MSAGRARPLPTTVGTSLCMYSPICSSSPMIVFALCPPGSVSSLQLTFVPNVFGGCFFDKLKIFARSCVNPMHPFTILNVFYTPVVCVFVYLHTNSYRYEASSVKPSSSSRKRSTGPSLSGSAKRKGTNTGTHRVHTYVHYIICEWFDEAAFFGSFPHL